MSRTILDFGKFYLTAIVGPNGDASVQVTIRDKEYVQLDSAEAYRLAMAILARLLRLPGYKAV